MLVWCVAARKESAVAVLINPYKGIYRVLTKGPQGCIHGVMTMARISISISGNVGFPTTALYPPSLDCPLISPKSLNRLNQGGAFGGSTEVVGETMTRRPKWKFPKNKGPIQTPNGRALLVRKPTKKGINRPLDRS